MEVFLLIMYKKIIAAMMVLVLIFSISSCKKVEEKKEVDDSKVTVEPTTITWWSLPVFYEMDGDTENFEQSLISMFKEKYPEITVEHKVLSMDTYQNELEDAQKNGTLPDVYFGYPSDVSKYAKDGKMANISDIIFSQSKSDSSDDDSSKEAGEDITRSQIKDMCTIPENVLMSATVDGEKTYTFYPVSVSPYVMAFNKQILEQAGALDLLPLDGDRSWTMEEYKSVLTKLGEGLADTDIDTGIFYYGSTIGARGSKNLISSVSGTMFEQDGKMLINSADGVAGMVAIKSLIDEGLLVNGMSVQSSTNLDAFLKGNVAHTILYSMDADLMYKSDKKDGFATVFMPYPTTGGASLLDYNLLGAAIFDNSDEQKVAAAKLFVDFLANDSSCRSSVAGRTGGFSANKEYNDFLEGEYAFFAQSLDMLAPYTELKYNTDHADLQWITCLNQVMYKESDIEEQLEIFEQTVLNEEVDEQGTDNSTEGEESQAK